MIHDHNTEQRQTALRAWHEAQERIERETRRYQTGKNKSVDAAETLLEILVVAIVLAAIYLSI